MRQLEALELDQCAGGLSFGTMLYNSVYSFNQSFLNTPAISSVGQTFNLFGPIGMGIHYAADTIGFEVMKATVSLANMMGNTNTAPIPYHYYTEW